MIKNLDKLKKAQLKFEIFRKHLDSEQEQLGAVQAFEFCYELSWKVMKNFLEEQVLEVGSPKDTFSQAALERIIPDPEIWFDFQKKRNITVHTYEEENLNLVISVFDAFSKELASLIMSLESLDS